MDDSALLCGGSGPLSCEPVSQTPGDGRLNVPTRLIYSQCRYIRGCMDSWRQYLASLAATILQLNMERPVAGIERLATR